MDLNTIEGHKTQKEMLPLIEELATDPMTYLVLCEFSTSHKTREMMKTFRPDRDLFVQIRDHIRAAQAAGDKALLDRIGRSLSRAADQFKKDPPHWEKPVIKMPVPPAIN